jgi:deoxyadenosine/deoxycytidine kinase
MHIAIAGNIGSGKTTLTSLLAKHFKWEPHYEDVVDNPYLDDFYHQMERWSFNLQIYFLNSRFRQVIHPGKRKESHSRPNDLWRRSYICAQPLFDGFDD